VALYHVLFPHHGFEESARMLFRLVRRHAEDGDVLDPVAQTSLALAGITSAAVQGRSALGPRAGVR
jgi:hypothetical protein